MNAAAPSPSVVHDPVAIAVEEHLRKLQAKGEGVFNADQEKDGVCLAFNGVVAQAADFDIAFVRLASALLDDLRFRVPLMQALRPPMFLAHEHRLQSCGDYPNRKRS